MKDYFSDSEFARIGCTRSDINPDSLLRLNAAREHAGIPFILTSAFRTPAQNASVRGALNSAHLRGRAFDIRCCSASDRYKILLAALAVGFCRIGIGRNFVHVDDDVSLPHPRIWIY